MHYKTLCHVIAIATTAFASDASYSSLKARGAPVAPDGYAPASVDCPPDRPVVRDADGLSQSEEDWLEVRREKTIPAMNELLSRLSIPNFDVDDYFERNGNNNSLLPNIGIAISGGGYRAMLVGAGVLFAFDDRTTDATDEGRLGGVLQSATYLTGLSGGSWLIGSIYMNNFTTVEDIISVGEDEEASIWQLENSVLEGPSEEGFSLFESIDYYDYILDSVESKDDAGFNTSLTDYWGRALSFQLIDDTDGGEAYTYSSISKDDYFVDGDAPMPIIVADGRAPGEVLIPINATNFEFNPWEMGSWDPSPFAFAPLRYIGSGFVEGSIPDDESCVRGVDNAGFIMGTSSSLFNAVILQLDTVEAPSFVIEALEGILEEIGDDNNDIADWPNPFFRFNNDTNLSSGSRRLTLVDGGLDTQNIPLEPLLVPERAVDVILAVDSSMDTESQWPNGTAMVASYQRFVELDNVKQWGFPYIPDQDTFVNLGLNNRPSFFGCNSSNVTGETPSPLIVYIPNSPYVYPSNVSTFQLEYNNTERDAIIRNGYEVATMGNATENSDWPTCLGCAILARSFERTDTDMPDACQQCMDDFCWNGEVDSSEPSDYVPELLGAEIEVNVASAGMMPQMIYILGTCIFAICFYI